MNGVAERCLEGSRNNGAGRGAVEEHIQICAGCLKGQALQMQEQLACLPSIADHQRPLAVRASSIEAVVCRAPQLWPGLQRQLPSTWARATTTCACLAGRQRLWLLLRQRLQLSLSLRLSRLQWRPDIDPWSGFCHGSLSRLAEAAACYLVDLFRPYHGLAVVIKLCLSGCLSLDDEQRGSPCHTELIDQAALLFMPEVSLPNITCSDRFWQKDCAMKIVDSRLV